MDDFLDSYDYDDEDREPDDDVRCKFCGVDGLYWTHTGERWRLMDGMKFHVCKPSADDFDVLDT